MRNRLINVGREAVPGKQSSMAGGKKMGYAEDDKELLFQNVIMDLQVLNKDSSKSL